MIDRFESTELALAAYNAGPTAVAAAGGAPNGASRRIRSRGDAALAVVQRLQVARGRPRGRSGDALRLAEAARCSSPRCSSASARARRSARSWSCSGRTRSRRTRGSSIAPTGSAAAAPRSAAACARSRTRRQAAVVLLADGPDLARGGDRPRGRGVAQRGGRGRRRLVRRRRGATRSLLGRAAWDDVPDEGARALEPVLVPCDDLGAPGDVDRPEDLPERFR